MTQGSQVLLPIRRDGRRGIAECLDKVCRNETSYHVCKSPIVRQKEEPRVLTVGWRGEASCRSDRPSAGSRSTYIHGGAAVKAPVLSRLLLYGLRHQSDAGGWIHLVVLDRLVD